MIMSSELNSFQQYAALHSTTQSTLTEHRYIMSFLRQ